MSTTTEAIAKHLKALANKRRLMIIFYLRNGRQVSVGEIAQEIKLSFKSTSRHLAVLRAAEIVLSEQQSLAQMYQLAQPHSPFVNYILTMC